MQITDIIPYPVWVGSRNQLVVKVETVTGQLSPANPLGQGWPIMIDLRDARRNILISQLVTTDGTGRFTITFTSNQFSLNQFNGQAVYATANFMGDMSLAGISVTSVIIPTKLHLPLIQR